MRIDMPQRAQAENHPLSFVITAQLPPLRQ
jgi:hypothetical protein